MVLSTLLLIGPLLAVPAASPAAGPATSLAAGPVDSLGEPVADDEVVHVGVALRASHASDLRQLLAAQQDPASTSYHAWLDPAGFADRFGLSQADYSEVLDWFAAHDFEVVASPNRLFLEAIGPVKAVRGAFGVQERWATARGRRFRTFEGELQLPPTFGDRILHLGGLDTRLRLRHHLNLVSQGMTIQALGPADLRVQYDIGPLLSSGNGGAGLITVVLGTQEGTSPGSAETCEQATPIPPFVPPSEPAIAAYEQLANATAPYNPIVLLNPGQDFDVCGSNQEAELDVEMQSVGAPNAAGIDLVLSPATEVFETGAQYVVNTLPTAAVVSTSLGLCEAESAQEGGGPTTSGSEMQVFQQTVQQGLAEGQTWFAAAGDTGADDCDDTTSGTHNGFGGGNATVDFPGSMPEMLDVGGTQFAGAASWDGNGNLLGFVSEAAWNEQESEPPSDQGGAAGGGQSLYYAKPAYQQGIGSEANDGARDVPDLALTAAAYLPGVAIYNCGSNQDQTCPPLASGPGGLSIYGGTSIGSPLAAGIFAALSSKIGCRLGDIHPTLYKLGQAQVAGGASVFHDITSGNNTYVGTSGATISGYSAEAGFDLVSGWGSLDAAVLADNWTGCSSGQGGGCGCGSAPGETLLIWGPIALIALRRRRR